MDLLWRNPQFNKSISPPSALRLNVLNAFDDNRSRYPYRGALSRTAWALRYPTHYPDDRTATPFLVRFPTKSSHSINITGLNDVHLGASVPMRPRERLPELQVQFGSVYRRSPEALAFGILAENQS